MSVHAAIINSGANLFIFLRCFIIFDDCVNPYKMKRTGETYSLYLLDVKLHKRLKNVLPAIDQHNDLIDIPNHIIYCKKCHIAKTLFQFSPPKIEIMPHHPDVRWCGMTHAWSCSVMARVCFVFSRCWMWYQVGDDNDVVGIDNAVAINVGMHVRRLHGIGYENQGR